VQDLISLTRALHHRGDRLHWLAILRAPWCGLTLADLHALAATTTSDALVADRRPGARGAPVADGRRRLAHLREVMAEALAGQGRQSRRRWVEDAWKKLGGPACLGAAASQAADAQAFFKRLDELDAAGRFALDSLEDDMARLFAAPDARADGRLQLMTIHKAKGLEFDTVILPGLHRGTPPPDAPLLAWDSLPLEAGERLLAAPVNRRRRRGKGEPTLYDFLQGLERDRAANEAARVLYVAVTRAVRRLHLVAVAKRKEDGTLAAPAGEFAAGAAVAAGRGASFAVAAVAPAPTVERRADSLRSRPPTTAHFVPRLCAFPPPRSPKPGARRRRPPQRRARGNRGCLAADVGTLVHALLEMAATDPRDPGRSRRRRAPAGFERWLAGRGWPEAAARDGRRARRAHAGDHAGQRRRPVGAAPARRCRRRTGHRAARGGGYGGNPRGRPQLRRGRRALDHRLQDRRPRAGGRCGAPRPTPSATAPSLKPMPRCSPQKACRCAWRCSTSRMASWRVWTTIVPAVEFTGFDRFARCRRIRHLRRLGDEKCPTRNTAW
jgi:ATP-dependent helicase/nuclease subunit A